MKTISSKTFYKCTRPDGTDFCTGTIDYHAAMKSGKSVEVLDAAPANGHICGHGIHVSPTARKTIQFANSSHRPWRWFKGKVVTTDIIECDDQKCRVKRFTIIKELTLADIFGNDFAERILAMRESTVAWQSIPWLKPSNAVSDDTVIGLVNKWREALGVWTKKKLSKKVRIVCTADAAEAAADAAADAAAAAADAAADAEAAADAAADAEAAADAAAAEAAADAAAAETAADTAADATATA